MNLKMNYLILLLLQNLSHPGVDILAGSGRVQGDLGRRPACIRPDLLLLVLLVLLLVSPRLSSPRLVS